MLHMDTEWYHYYNAGIQSMYCNVYIGDYYFLQSAVILPNVDYE